MDVSVVFDETVGTEFRESVRRAHLRSILRFAADILSLGPGEIVVRCTDDPGIRELNRAFREVDAPTDVLAFPIGEYGVVGDIAISVERAVRQAPGRDIEEIRLLAVHGLIHCLGYDHATVEDAARMTEMTRRCLPRQTVAALSIHE